MFGTQLFRGFGAAAFCIASLVALPRAAGAELRYEITISAEDLRFSRAGSFDLVALGDHGFITAPGHPMLPAQQICIALPEGVTALGASAHATASRALPGTYFIYPAQPPARVGAAAGESPWVEPDASVYAAHEPYPATTARLLGQTDLAGQALAIVELYPVRYDPASGTLTLHTAMSVALQVGPGSACGDYLAPNASAATRAFYGDQLRRRVINPEDVVLRAPAPAPAPAPDAPDALARDAGGPSRALPAGQYDYVIIASSSLAAGFAPLIEWKTRKGVPATLVTTSWIYNQGGYAGSECEKIRAFVIDAHDNWGTSAFLLGGDNNTVPSHWRETAIEPYLIPNDTYYADFDGDWTVEVHVGRASVRYASWVQTFVGKVLAYEQDPPLSDYARAVGLLGFDLDDNTAGEVCKQAIDSQYIPPTWAVSSVYDTGAGNHRDAALALLSAGHNLVNHIDHADVNQLGVGSYHHNLWLGPDGVEDLTNAREQSVIYSIGCYASNYDAHTCIAENFTRCATGGAVGFVGNSRFGWFNPGNLNTLSMRYDRQFFAAFFGGQTQLGGCFSAHKNAFYPSDETYRYCFTELNLLGDPELPLWTADPQALMVAHPAVVPPGPGEFAVRVTASGGAGIEGARVCLWKGAEVYARGYTDAGGDVTLAVAPETAGALLVTVTAAGRVPYLGEATVRDPSGDAGDAGARASWAFLGGTRNPFDTATEIRFLMGAAGPVQLRIYDLAGREVRDLTGGAEFAAGTHAVAWDGRDSAARALPAGVYFGRWAAGPAAATQRLLIVR